MENNLAPLFLKKLPIPTRLMIILLTCMAVFLSGCQTVTRNSTSVGPSFDKPAIEKKHKFSYDSNIFLDVAVPVFDPGIPEESDEITEKGIWPQLRRAEASRFALKTKQALEEMAVFGNVSVVPNSQVTADLFVIGRIDESNSRVVKINIEVVDITGKKWGKKTFEHEVSEGFYRDRRNVGKDPYQPIFDDIAVHVYKLLKRRREKEKTKIKQITDIRFSQNFSPQTYSKYLSTNRKGHITLTGLPSEDDPMSKRIEPLRLQDQLFVDRLQLQYETFSAKMDDSYKSWQKETLPILVEAEKAESKAFWRKILGGAAIVGAVVASKNNSSFGRQLLTTGAIIGGGFLLKDGFGQSAEAKIHRATIDEMGETLDVEMDSQVMSLEAKTVELTGTANDQYLQWREHLKKIYALEETADVNLDATPEEDSDALHEVKPEIE